MAAQTGPKDTTGNRYPPDLAATPAGGSPGGTPGRADAKEASAPPPKRKAGRKREDGLVTGSAAAIEADKERDRIRKQQERALADPAALPSAGQANGDQVPPEDAAQGPGSGDGSNLPAVPWEAKEFLPIIGKAFDGAEKNRMARREFLAREAGFSDPAVRKFVNDARYPGASKESLIESGAEGLAWGANKLKMSRGAVKGGMGLIAMAMFILENRRSDAQFAKAIDEMKKGNPPEEKKS